LQFDDLLEKIVVSENKDLSPAALFGAGTLVSFVNPANFLDFLKYRVNDFDYVFSDGVLLSKLINQKVKRRSFDYSSLAHIFFGYCQIHNKSVLAVGGTIDEAAKFEQFIRSKYPHINLRVVSGYTPHNHTSYITDNYRDEDILLLSLGSPLQNDVSVEMREKFRDICCVTCGAFIKQTVSSGGVYYPEIFNRLNLRWLYRSFFDSHVRKRLIIDYPWFLILFFKSEFFKFLFK
jgi:UDP-Gal:alpha-D-GlcNAc-diphosphoundecaprenol beta-1,4-galactosyltransferase